MKKYIITIIFSLGMVVNVSAQSDGFFSYTNSENRNTGSTWSETPRLPAFEGTENQSAPVGSGILLLAGMAFAYGLKKK